MSIRVAITGFGRIGRLALRAGWARPDLHFVHVNEIAADPHTAAHLLAFDSVHGRWQHAPAAAGEALEIDGHSIGYSQIADPQQLDWAALGVDLVIEATGKFRTLETLAPHLQRGARKVVVAAPVPGAVNIVMGVNQDRYDPQRDAIVTAASCTTNCLAPIVQVVHHRFGIRHGSITTVHCATGTQHVVDKGHRDLRRARSTLESLIPTSTGSATAIGAIFPELEGRLNGLAVRVPLLGASLTDCVFELGRETGAEAANAALREAAQAGPLAGILGFEERPLVSVDFRGDTRSAIVDGPSTLVVGGTQLKLLAWYDNEMGYAHRLVELAQMVGTSL